MMKNQTKRKNTGITAHYSNTKCSNSGKSGGHVRVDSGRNEVEVKKVKAKASSDCTQLQGENNIPRENEGEMEG